ncbi:MAG: hypothetical protein JO192_07575 [Candidatus Eremiobacteraeota bacterium]|nr:hypothetical protein [Candidatus Eremiobacteraeota bacterium]MBV8721387.1 hypothetical protein [Candidatus Eremiobacteraeota bacterium]
MPRWIGPAAALGLVVALGIPRPAAAVPIFAHQYGVSCRKCHTVIPHLNAFGAAFLANGDRIPGVAPGPAFPIAMKTNLVVSSADQGPGPNGQGLPKAIVDEIELFTAGAIGPRASYLVEQYLVDGGEPGYLRDAWVTDRVNPWTARVPVQVQAGSFTLPLPVDPETFRETYQDYTPYVQTVGANPFDFKEPKTGGRIAAGDTSRGLSVQLFAGPGYDQRSSLATIGTDVMENVTDSLGPVALAFYHYQGQRPIGGSVDAFTRTGYSVVYNGYARWSSETVLQTGWDSHCTTRPDEGCASSGGFTQLRYAFDRRLFAEGRYEGTYDPIAGLARDGVLLVGYAPIESARATVEDVISAQTSTFNAQVTVAL